MKPINWNPEKNRKLIEAGSLLDDITHPNTEKYAQQRVFVVAIDEYVYLIPYVETDEEIFLKTIVPSRKATKHYLGGKT